MPNLPILLFDNSCGVCHWLVRFVIRHDTSGRFRFAALDSGIGEELRRRYRIDPSLDTVVLVDGNRAWIRSHAVIRILILLGWPWRMGAVAAIVPARWRDAGYDLFVTRRAAVSARLRLTCIVPKGLVRNRFLDLKEPAVSNDANRTETMG